MSQQINLYDPALRAKREWLTAGSVAGVAAALLAVMIAWGSWARMSADRLGAEAAALAPQVQSLQEQTAALGNEIAGRKPDARLEQDLVVANGLLKLRGEVLAVLDKGLGADAPLFSDYLRGLARQAPGGLWLTGFSVGGDAMEIRGRMLDPASLPEYIRRLNSEKVFQGRAFAALRMSTGAAVPAAPASVSAGQAPAPAVAPQEAPFHEFMLVPAKAAAKAPGGQP